MTRTILLLAAVGVVAACAGRNRPPGGVIVDMKGVEADIMNAYYIVRK